MISERDIIYITKKQASIALVALAVFCILMFMLGYFWGKQCVLEGFGQRITQDSMNDQADYESMMQLFADKTRPEASCERTDFSLDATTVQESLKDDHINDEFSQVCEQFEPVAETIKKQIPPVKPASNKNKDGKLSLAKDNDKAASPTTPVSKKWSAILVGFATKQHALNFVQRLQNRGITVQIRTRISKSATGKAKKMWFQVVTTPYNSKEELDEVVAQIKKTEHIKSSDIKII